MALYHSAKGSVDYTVVGNPTITDGIASGFTRNDSLRTSQSFTDSGQDFSMQFSIKNFTQATDINPIVSSYESSIGGNYFAIVINSPSSSINPNRFSARIKGASLAVQSTHTIDYTKSYQLLFQRVGGVYTLEVYQDGALVDTQQLVSSELLAAGAAFTFNIGANNYYFPVGFSGSIDLKKTYIQSNGQPWFGVCPVEVKKHQIMGPVSYTKVGSPTITDGVFNTTSATDYLTIANFPYGQENVNWEIVVRAKPGTGYGPLLGASAYGCLLCQFRSNSLILNADTDLKFSDTFDSNTYYFVRIRKQQNTYLFDYSVNGIDFSNTLSKNNILTSTTPSRLEIGHSTINFANREYYDNSVDLNETYIKVNGKLWYYQPAPTKYIVKDNKLVFASQDLHLSGPVNYSKVGSPTIVDNVVSGFSSSNYVETASNIPYNNSSWEYQICFTTTTDVTSGQLLIENAYLPGNGEYQGLTVFIADSSGQITIRCGTGSSQTITAASAGGTLAANTKYYFQAIFDGIDRYTYKLGTSKDNLETIYANSSSYKIPNISYPVHFGIRYMSGSYSTPFNGSIDLNETYIKINNQLWFYGKNYASKNIAPVPAGYHTKGQVGCTAVGSPTVVNGIISNATSSNYINMESSLDGNSDYELQYKFIFNESFTGSRCLQLTNSYYMGWDVAMAEIQYHAGKNSNNSWCKVGMVYSLSLNTWYWLKLIKTGDNFKTYISTDGISFEEIRDITFSDISYQTQTIGIARQDSGKTFPGSIDLNETYIKVNGKLWFDGKGQYPFTGYADMRTQAFTAAPSGATIERDE